MAMQETGTPPKTKRSGIFPHSIRNAVIISSIIVFLIIAVIGGIGIWDNWGVAYNLIFLILAVASVVIGLLAFWSSKKSAEAGAPASNPSTQQPPQGSGPGYTPANPPSSSSPTPGTLAQQDDLEDDEINQIAQDLIDGSEAVLDNVIRIYGPPSGVARTGSIPFRVDELVKTARKRRDLQRLRNAYYTAIGVMPPPVKKKLRAD